jgi:hypothetical protein
MCRREVRWMRMLMGEVWGFWSTSLVKGGGLEDWVFGLEWWTCLSRELVLGMKCVY